MKELILGAQVAGGGVKPVLAPQHHTVHICLSIGCAALKEDMQCKLGLGKE